MSIQMRTLTHSKLNLFVKDKVMLVYSMLGTVLTLLIAVSIGLSIFNKAKGNSNLLKKIIEIVKGWWIIFSVLSLSCFFGEWGIWVLFLLLSVTGVFEYFKITRLEFSNKFLIQIVYTLGVITFYFLGTFLNLLTAYLFSIVFQLFITSILLIQNKRQEDFTLSIAIGMGLFSLITAVFSAVQIVFLGEKNWSTEGAGIAALITLIFLTSLNDIFQFIGGKLFGKLKLVPSLSPNKTEAGFITGIVCTSLLGGILFFFLIGITWFQGMAIGAIGLSGILGDLFFSAVKRANHVKDFSNLIPGHGGLLDRLDSLIFTAPVFHLLIYLFFENK